jgi:hypothetical protein
VKQEHIETKPLPAAIEDRAGTRCFYAPRARRLNGVTELLVNRHSSAQPSSTPFSTVWLDRPRRVTP